MNDMGHGVPTHPTLPPVGARVCFVLKLSLLQLNFGMPGDARYWLFNSLDCRDRDLTLCVCCTPGVKLPYVQYTASFVGDVCVYGCVRLFSLLTPHLTIPGNEYRFRYSIEL